MTGLAVLPHDLASSADWPRNVAELGNVRQPHNGRKHPASFAKRGGS